MGSRYCVITPCRNEEKYLPTAIQTMASQSVLPDLWVIVDDGSTDKTVEIVQDAMKQYPFILLVQKEDRGHRHVGAGVVEAFYAGLRATQLKKFDYICKMDADVILPPLYFQRVIEKMMEDPCLGNYSGKVYLQLPDGSLMKERMGDENAVGLAKFYRRECFEEIGGFVPQVGWDGIDGHLCRMHNWIAMSEDKDDLRVIEMRQMGASQENIWVGRQRWGRGKYIIGSTFLYILAVSFYRMFTRPYVIGGIGILLGYIKAWFKNEPRYGNEKYRQFLRKFERYSLFFGKKRACTIFNQKIREARCRQKK